MDPNPSRIEDVPNSPVVSCLCVTQLSRVGLFARAAHDFQHQICPGWERELVVVHHDGPTASAVLAAHAPFARILAVDPAPLGELRNHAVRAARGEVLVQWDDDDLNHPDRVAAHLRSLAGEDCSFLGEQVTWFEHEGFVAAWAHRPVWGTLAAKASLGIEYAPLRKGEDAELYERQLKHVRVACIEGRPGLYVRRFHSGNTWGFAHHLSHLVQRGLPRPALAARRDQLVADCRTLGIPDGTPVLGREGLAFRV